VTDGNHEDPRLADRDRASQSQSAGGGHTPGHVSVIAVDGDVGYFLAGDTTYTQKALIEGRVDGVSPSAAVSMRRMQTIMRLAQDRPMVYLPTHDPESANRLENGVTVPATEVLQV